MRYIDRLIISSCLLFSSSAFAAYEVFLDPLYWRATETFDWQHSNNLDPQYLAIAYKAVAFDFEPGFRAGLAYEGNWDTKFYYTKFVTTGIDSAQGNLTTGYLAGRLSQTVPTSFYKTAHANYHINFNMIDWDVGKRFAISDALMLRPLVGLEVGVINQTFNTSFQSQAMSMSEHVINNFKGVGPKLGMETSIVFWRANDFNYSLIADVESSYLFGNWHFSDKATTTNSNIYIANVANRNYGSLGIQAMMGASVTHKNFLMSVGYEMSDWMNQCQFFDDETGSKSADLVLQGLTLQLSYKF